MLLMGLFFGSLLIAAIGAVKWYDARAVERAYRDGLFAIVKVLDLPLKDWEAQYKGAMTDAEWFGFVRGYTQGLWDALEFLAYGQKPPLHTNRLEPRPTPEPGSDAVWLSRLLEVVPTTPEWAEFRRHIQDQDFLTLSQDRQLTFLILGVPDPILPYPNPPSSVSNHPCESD